MPFTYEYPRPAVTVDCVVFGLDQGVLQLLLIKRNSPPFAGCWALPGGFVDQNETLDAAARRELEEETGLREVFLEQLFTFGDPGRDPRGHTVSVAYYALVRQDRHVPQAATDTSDAVWYSVAKLPKLAFDHQRIISTAVARLQGKVRYQPINFELLPRKFTLTELQGVYEAVLERALDKRNFRKKILAMGLLAETKEKQQGVAHRAPQLYQFDAAKYKKLTKQGFNFEL
ncbi:MAG: NUDIX hydrolase [Acidobacteria bacterium]|nr:NUDIX hydrolase [Acidobacteriota bacterium]